VAAKTNHGPVGTVYNVHFLNAFLALVLKLYSMCNCVLIGTRRMGSPWFKSQSTYFY
jgi:NADH/NAD ratio-sensing transcriptional regulator Rex